MAFALHQDLIEKSNDLSHQSKKFYKQAKVLRTTGVCVHTQLLLVVLFVSD